MPTVLRKYLNILLFSVLHITHFSAAAAGDSFVDWGSNSERVALFGSTGTRVAVTHQFVEKTAGSRLLGNTEVQQGVFLVAKRHISDPRFRRTVIFVTTHDHRGSHGLVINRPSDVGLANLLPEWSKLLDPENYVYYGGPVEVDLVRYLVRSPIPLDGSVQLLDDIYMVTHKGILVSLLEDNKLRRGIRAYVGYAGWAVGQLEHEILRGDWYVIEADSKSLFDNDPAGLWRELMKMLSGRWVHLD